MPHSLSTKLKLAKIVPTKERIQKIKEARAKQKIPRSTIEAMNASWRKPIVDMYGNSFDSIKEAAYFWNLPGQTVQRIASGIIKNPRSGIKFYYKEINK